MDEEKYISKMKSDCNLYDDSVKNNIMPYLKDLGAVLCVVLILFLFCFRIAVVDGSSMKNTLVDGDLVLLLNSAVAGEPQQGDIIVASKSTYADGAPIIKRVIATEHQKVDIDFSTGTVTVDGVVLEEPYISTITDDFEGISFPYVVEEGCVFVMGDNRGNSKDSRHPAIGTIDYREIVGKAFFLIAPGTDKGNQKRDFSRIGALS